MANDFEQWEAARLLSSRIQQQLYAVLQKAYAQQRLTVDEVHNIIYMTLLHLMASAVVISTHITDSSYRPLSANDPRCEKAITDLESALHQAIIRWRLASRT